MARPNHRPVVLPDAVRIETTVGPEVATALDTLVAATGEAKASHLRRALTRYLADLDLFSEQRTTVTLTPLNTPKKGIDLT
ncbi:hypothetical protein ACFT30_13590 [Microbacterium ureisolvens]|uniref:hypothetical protein n=1 Tax=Microbacterium ureisolvens TaxID=2781186 RepID=UPI003639DD29